MSLTTEFDQALLTESGPTLKKVLDAVEGFEMPPADAEQPTRDERRQLAAGIRGWLTRPALGEHRDPGQPILRRLTRLEYNNTVRDLLGLETDVFVFSERLPFERGHYQPKSRAMPDRLTMSAREYGAKYPVLLRDASLPGDSRAEYGFANRGDSQNLSAVRLQQYVKLAGEIAFHPELLSRGERMQELFPNARFRQIPTGVSRQTKPLTTSNSQLAGNNNVARTAEGSAFKLADFRRRIVVAYKEDRGGVFSGEELRNTKIAGKGGLVRIAYGKNAIRTIAINPNEDWWFAPFATAVESSGDTLLANYKKRQRTYELTFQSVGSQKHAGIAELGFVILSRRGESGDVRLKVAFDDGGENQLSVELKPGAGADNTFVSFAAPEGRHIKRLAIDGSGFSGDYVLLDDLAFITRDAPNRQPLVQAETPATTEVRTEQRSRLKLNLELAKRPPRARLSHFMRRAFRRDVEPSEVDVYLTLYQSEVNRGGSDEAGMRAAMQGVLASPSFLYLNVGKEEASLRQVPVTPLSDYELAARLSYFVWSSMPDDELFQLAAAGKLQDDAILEAQVRRMLLDPRSIELSENFYTQWLRLQELWSAQPDRRLFPTFYTGPLGKRTLASDMFGEALLLFQTIMVEDRPLTELLSAEYTFVNGKLIDFYGGETSELRTWLEADALPAEARKTDRVWHRVKKFDPQRGGIVTSPAVLTLTSFPHRTSSIRRGVWILDTLFNRHPPPPKVAVADIDEQDNTKGLTLREKVRLHRAEAACAVCHDRIDPPGLALENFDAIGRWRTKDGDEVVDASGELAGIGKFDEPAKFTSLLLMQRKRFVQGFAEHLLSFALGRRLEYFDTPAVDEVVRRTIEDDCRPSRLIVEIVKSYPFRYSRGIDE